MKKLLFAALMLFAGCSNPDTAHESNTGNAGTAGLALLSFKKSTYDFGTIQQGEKVSYNYEFSNKGKTPLIITDATATCGCTVPNYPKEPIAPGENGVIKVVFDSAGKSGHQSKAITITSNSNPPNTVVYLTGEVKVNEPKTN